MNAMYPDEKGELNPLVMGCYGIGVGRILAGVLEQRSDKNGINFPKSIAPYQATIVGLNTDQKDVTTLAETIYLDLMAIGVEVLYDDREETAGVKLNDSDLIGLPIRIVVSRRNLAKGKVEIKLRSEDESSLVDISETCDKVKSLLTTENK
jgi:prolyl-tRNA synthetase